MDDDSKKRLQVNFCCLVDNINVEDSLGNYLYQLGVIDDEELELITSRFGQSTKGQVRTLIKILRCKPNPDVFQQFCKALRACEYEYLAETLETCDPSGVVLDDVDAPQKNKVSLLDKIAEQSSLLLSIRDEHLAKISRLEEENKKLREERDITVDAAKNIGIMDESFIDMFIISSAHKSDYASGDVEKKQSLGDLRQLNLTWELLTVCRLSIDVVHYTVAVSAKRQPPEAFCRLAVLLRNMIDETLAKTEMVEIFEAIPQSLDYSEILGYGTLPTIADEVFAKGRWNWGRVVCWYAFCANLACGFPVSTCSDAFDVYGAYIWFFLDKRYSKEISEAGGWVSFSIILKFIVICNV